MASVSTTQTTQSNNVVLAKDFKAASVKFTDPKKKKDGKTSVALLVKDSTFYLETPYLKAPFGISTFVEKGKEDQPKKWTLPLSAEGIDDASKELVSSFFGEIEHLDNFNQEFLTKHPELCGKTQQGKVKSAQSIGENMWRMLKKNKDPQYADRITPTIYGSRNKLPDGTFEEDSNRPGISVYMAGSSEEHHPESFEELQTMIPKGSFVKAILVIREAMTAQNAGLTCSVVQLLVRKRTNNKLSGYAFSEPVENAPGDNADESATVDTPVETEVVEEKPDSDKE